MRRRLLALATVPLLLTACSGGDDSDEPGGSGEKASASVSPELDGQYTQPGIAQDAKVGAFCTAMEGFDDAVDDGEAGDADSWLRIVAALDEVWETGVPKDLSSAGIAEIDRVDTLVRQSNSVEEFEQAVTANPPKTDVVDDYVDEHCE